MVEWSAAIHSWAKRWRSSTLSALRRARRSSQAMTRWSVFSSGTNFIRKRRLAM